MNREMVLRHPLAVRLCHGLIAASGLLLAFSGIGFMPLYGRFYLNEVPGLAWVSDFAVQMHLHYLVAALLAGGEEPPHGKFLAEQRLAYLAIAAVSMLLTISGLLLAARSVVPFILPPAFLQIVILTHQAANFLFQPLVAAHAAAFLLRANRPLLSSMLTGKVERRYAAGRHPQWRP